MAAHEGAVALAGLVETDLAELDARGLFQLDGLDFFQVAALGDVAQGDLAGVGLGVGDEAFPVMEAGIVGTDVDLAVDDHADGDGHIILGGVLLEQAADQVGHAVVIVLQEGIAVGRGDPEVVEAEGRVAAGLVDHEDRDLHDLADLLQHGPGHLVSPATGPEGDDEGHGPSGIILGFFYGLYGDSTKKQCA